MPVRVGILHYSSPPVIGGVEALIGHQAKGLAAGCAVRVISGSGGALAPPIETHLDPLFSSTHPDVLSVKAALDSGHVPDDFYALRDRLVDSLASALDGCAVCIAHNVATMNKSLALTAALQTYSDRRGLRLIGYVHDIAAANPQYTGELHAGYPWTLLSKPWPRTRYVTISALRQAELAALFQINPAFISVLTPGVDLGAFFRWTPITQTLVAQLRLLDADGLLLLPARLTRRKNIELALRILRALLDMTALDFRLLVSGPPGPHNPTNAAYLNDLLRLRAVLGLEARAHFLYQCGPTLNEPLLVDDATMSDLYQLADALLFPSTQEGFGIPILEAGLARLPIFCADIPPLRQTAGADAVYFDPSGESPEGIAQTIWSWLSASPQYRLNLRVRHSYQWEQIIGRQLMPLIAEEVV